ncbi:MAG: helix-turn-helix transcriptional regulator [Clostridia bacterium]|nr:helix-turn-helix transcriptional regulator [Clostridia bacterium]
MNDVVLKNNIKQARQKEGLSQEELAKKTGTTRQTIISIEKNLFNPSAKLALLICMVLNEKFENLFYF